MTTTLIAGAMLIGLLGGLALALAWPPAEHPGVDVDADHPLYGPLGQIITRGQIVERGEGQ